MDKLSLIDDSNDKRELTYLQKQKYHVFVPIVGKMADDLVRILEPRGRNSFEKVYQKVKAIEQASWELQNYHDALYDSFEVNQNVNSFEIIERVSQVRRDQNLPPYLTRIKANCEKDFFDLFIVKDALDADSKPCYQPVFKLKPEDE